MDQATHALEELIRTRRAVLTGYAYLLCGSLGEAEDLFQDALVSALARDRSRPTVASIEAYVRTTMRNTYVDGFRRRRRWVTLRHLYVFGEAQMPSSETTTDHVPVRVDVQRALATLSPRQRTCVVLRFYDDLTVPQIADALSLSTGTVKRHLSDAAQRLAARLADTPPLGPEVLDDRTTDDLPTTDAAGHAEVGTTLRGA